MSRRPRSPCTSSCTLEATPPTPGSWRREGDLDYCVPVAVTYCQCLKSHLIAIALLSDNNQGACEFMSVHLGRLTEFMEQNTTVLGQPPFGPAVREHDQLACFVVCLSRDPQGPRPGRDGLEPRLGVGCWALTLSSCFSERPSARVQILDSNHRFM